MPRDPRAYAADNVDLSSRWADALGLPADRPLGVMGTVVVIARNRVEAHSILADRVPDLLAAHIAEYLTTDSSPHLAAPLALMTSTLAAVDGPHVVLACVPQDAVGGSAPVISVHRDGSTEVVGYLALGDEGYAVTTAPPVQRPAPQGQEVHVVVYEQGIDGSQILAIRNTREAAEAFELEWRREHTLYGSDTVEIEAHWVPA